MALLASAFCGSTDRRSALVVRTLIISLLDLAKTSIAGSRPLGLSKKTQSVTYRVRSSVCFLVSHSPSKVQLQSSNLSSPHFRVLSTHRSFIGDDRSNDESGSRPALSPFGFLASDSGAYEHSPWPTGLRVAHPRLPKGSWASLRVDCNSSSTALGAGLRRVPGPVERSSGYDMDFNWFKHSSSAWDTRG